MPWEMLISEATKLAIAPKSILIYRSNFIRRAYSNDPSISVKRDMVYDALVTARYAATSE